ncbi:MAG TPA: hypothetical protein VGO47_03635, partial [Chlamydiales bacterium]|nr:hypothetical protein [Chlamydiales bacterium]
MEVQCVFLPDVCIFILNLSFYLITAPSVRDDLEGLGYVFAHLQQQSLPWIDTEHVESECTALKMSTTTRDLFRGMPPVFIKFFNTVKTLAWNEHPNYEEMIDDFNQTWKASGYDGSPLEVNWW